MDLETPEEVNDILFKMLPLSCLKDEDSGETINNGNGVKLVLPPSGPFSFLAIEGDSDTGASLLFQAAVTMAAAGDRVTYMTSRPLERLPPAVHGMPVPAADSMHRVQLLYLPSPAAVLDHLASLHLTPPETLPDALLLALPPASAAPPSEADRCLQARLRAGLQEAAAAVAGVRGRCAAAVAAPPSAGGRWRWRTARLTVCGPGQTRLSLGRLQCRLNTASPDCLWLHSVTLSP